MLGMNQMTGRPLDGLGHLEQSIRDILTTRRGTRVLRRDYGSDLPALVDRPMTPGLTVDLFAETARALRQWEPRIRVDRVAVANTGAGRIALTVHATVTGDGRTLTTEVAL